VRLEVHGFLRDLIDPMKFFGKSNSSGSDLHGLALRQRRAIKRLKGCCRIALIVAEGQEGGVGGFGSQDSELSQGAG